MDTAWLYYGLLRKQTENSEKIEPLYGTNFKILLMTIKQKIIHGKL